MPETAILDAAAADQTVIADAVTEPSAEPLLSDLLVEDVSIDGMCGVY